MLGDDVFGIKIRQIYVSLIFLKEAICIPLSRLTCLRDYKSLENHYRGDI